MKIDQALFIGIVYGCGLMTGLLGVIWVYLQARFLGGWPANNHNRKARSR